MPDYNIYIHDLTGGSGESVKPTQPTNPSSPTKPKPGISDAAPLVENIPLTKATAAVAATFAAVKIAQIAFEVLLPFVTSSSGDYRLSVSYSNFKQTISNIKNPVGSTFSYLTAQHNFAITNKRQEQQRLLFGDSLINKNGGNI